MVAVALVSVVAVLCTAAAGCGGDGDDGRDATARTTTSSTTSTVTTSPPATTAATVAPAATAPPATTAAAADGPDAAHVFPLRPADAGTYARSHHDYPAADIFAPCGTEVVAVTGGVVQELSRQDLWSAATDSGETRSGLFVSVVGDDGVRYYGSHLRSVDDAVRPGTRVTAGQRLGLVGDTGNAAGTGCHLHFGLSAPCGPGDWERRRGEVWPQRYLDEWTAGRDAAPATEIEQRRC